MYLLDYLRFAGAPPARFTTAHAVILGSCARAFLRAAVGSLYACTVPYLVCTFILVLYYTLPAVRCFVLLCHHHIYLCYHAATHRCSCARMRFAFARVSPFFHRRRALPHTFLRASCRTPPPPRALRVLPFTPYLLRHRAAPPLRFTPPTCIPPLRTPATLLLPVRARCLTFARFRYLCRFVLRYCRCGSCGFPLLITRTIYLYARFLLCVYLCLIYLQQKLIWFYLFTYVLGSAIMYLLLPYTARFVPFSRRMRAFITATLAVYAHYTYRFWFYTHFAHTLLYTAGCCLPPRTHTYHLCVLATARTAAFCAPRCHCVYARAHHLPTPPAAVPPRSCHHAFPRCLHAHLVLPRAALFRTTTLSRARLYATVRGYVYWFFIPAVRAHRTYAARTPSRSFFCRAAPTGSPPMDHLHTTWFFRYRFLDSALISSHVLSRHFTAAHCAFWMTRLPYVLLALYARLLPNNTLHLHIYLRRTAHRCHRYAYHYLPRDYDYLPHRFLHYLWLFDWTLDCFTLPPPPTQDFLYRLYLTHCPSHTRTHTPHTHITHVVLHTLPYTLRSYCWSPCTFTVYVSVCSSTLPSHILHTLPLYLPLLHIHTCAFPPLLHGSPHLHYT